MGAVRGRKEWTGDWSDHSSLWTARLKSLAGWVDCDDGSFWMSWQDFVHNFDELYVCRFYEPRTFPCQGAMDGGWDSLTAGGCCNHPTVERNVQLAITCIDDGQQADVELVVELIQADCRGSGKEPPIVILELYDNDGQPVTQRSRGRLLANKGNNTLAVHIQLTLTRQQAQRTVHAPLTLLPCTYQPGTVTSYSLRWFASSTVHVQRFGGSGQAADNKLVGGHAAESPPSSQQGAHTRDSSERRVSDDSSASRDVAAARAQSQSLTQEQPQADEERSLQRASISIAGSLSPSPSAAAPKSAASKRVQLERAKKTGVMRAQPTHPTPHKLTVIAPGQPDEFEL